MSEQNAQRLIDSYEPADEGRFRSMRTIFADAETPDMLKKLILLYLPDMSYARSDIAHAEKYVRLLKGWA